MADSKAGSASNRSPEQERTREEFDRETHGLRPDVDELTPISGVRAPNVFERAKEEFEAIVQTIHPKKDHHLPNPDPSHSDAELETKSESLDSEKSKKAHGLIEKAKDSLKERLHMKKATHHRETHGRSDDIDETTPLDEIKGPNVFERAKEEVEAIVEAIHPRKATHHRETHGRSDDIDETTPLDEIKGPNVFERAKEEVEAIVEAIHPKKDTGRVISSTKNGDGLGVSVGKTLEKICSPGRSSSSISSKKAEGGLGASMGRRLEKICSPHSRNKD